MTTLSKVNVIHRSLLLGVHKIHFVCPQRFFKLSGLNRTKMRSPQALLLSSSNCHGYNTLEFAKREITSFFEDNNVKNIIFVPFAQNDYDSYTSKTKQILEPWGISVTGLHTYNDPYEAVKTAKGIFVGGGNTFLLLTKLYEYNLVDLIKQRVLNGQMVYMGSSAGTNVATKSIHTTNDMPIIYPPSFNAINLVPFNINPHYIDMVDEKHKGESRDQRIEEFLQMPHSGPVLGLREGSLLHLDGKALTIKGVAGAVLFTKDGMKSEYTTGKDVCFLLNSGKEMGPVIV